MSKHDEIKTNIAQINVETNIFANGTEFVLLYYYKANQNTVIKIVSSVLREEFLFELIYYG
jgi:hypothetical protein